MKELIVDFINEFKEQVISIKKDDIKKQIPNILTFSRALAPFIIIPTVLFGKITLAIIELVFFAITDFLDGRLARKYNCVTSFGVKLDAICDKLFAFAVIIPAIFKYPVLTINLALEICISYINMLSELKNNHPRSNFIGKVKTVFLSITLILSYIDGVDGLYVLMFSIITFTFQIWAFVKYREMDMIEDQKKTYH